MNGPLSLAPLFALALLTASPSPAQTHAPGHSHGPGRTHADGEHKPGASYRIGALVIEAPWSRATPGGAKVAAGYMRITNTGSESDRLVGGSFLHAARFEVHEMSNVDNVMRMRPLEAGLEIKPAETVELKPGGLHAMFLDLRQGLKEGDRVKGTLVFEKAGTASVDYAVRAIGARGAPEHKH